MYFSRFLIFIFSVFSLIKAEALFDNTNTLIIVDDPNHYSSYIESLRSRDFKITIKHASNDESSLDLIKYGQLVYKNVIIFPTKSKSLGPKLSSKILLEYFNLGGNILAVTNSKSSPESLREFAAELDIHISPRGYQIVDHFNSDGNNGNHTSIKLNSDNIKAPGSVISPIISGEDSTTSIPASSEFIYSSGNAAYLGNNELIIPFISAPSTSYTYDARQEDESEETVANKLWVSGSQSYLAAGLQSRSNSRFSWIGSSDLFKDGAAASSSIIDNITKWTFNEKSIIRITNVSHYDLIDPTVENPHIYKVSTDILYKLSVSEWNGNKWVAFNANDIQLEFIMLDPYYRITLERNESAEAAEPESTSAIYTTQFKAPDQYGMFTFKTSYRRPGYSFIEDSRVVTVRHTANNEWPRSWEITNSWVYLTSSFSVVIAWFIFVIIYLYAGYTPKKTDKKTQ